MRVVLNEWKHDPVACMYLAIWFVVSVVYTVLNAYVVILISNTFASANSDEFRKNIFILLAVCLIQICLSMIRGYFRPLATHHCFGTLNNRYADKVIDADADMFTKFSCAHINTLGEYIFRISGMGVHFGFFVINIINIITTLVSIYIVGGKLVFPVIVIYGIVAIVAKRLFHTYDVLDKRADEIKKVRNQEMENIVNGFAEVRTFNTQEYHRKRIADFNDAIYADRVKRSRIQMWINCIIESMDTVGMSVVIFYAMGLMVKGLINQAQSMSLVMYVFRIVNPISEIMDSIDTFSMELAMAKQYGELIGYVNHNSISGNIRLDEFNSSIEMENISFAYDGSGSVLRNVSMKFPKGKKIGICGVSGAGKSTLFKLLNRFYDQQGGMISIDGIDIRNINRESFRRQIGCVQQDNIIFPGTIMDNVVYGNFNAMEHEIVEACKKAHIYDFIMGLPEKFNSKVGPRGITLSGGQKQRIALARLFLSNPSIILLDEATSALDNESETLIQDAIDGLQGKTIITIAHRLSTIRNSDLIYVLGPEGVIESGTHDELVALHGAYASMIK